MCWKKFCIYSDVEMRAVPVREDYLVLDSKDVPQHVDENTIGVVSIFGSTYNGQFEDVQALDAVVGESAGRPSLSNYIAIFTNKLCKANSLPSIHS